MTESTPQWHAAFPTPAFDTPRMSPESLADIMNSKVAGVDYLVVDVRRTDFEGIVIHGAINLPAHSFYQTISTIATLIGNIPHVVFHCNSCSETGRGPRVAGWYAEHLRKLGITTSQAWVLDGGIKKFGSLYAGDKLVDNL